MTPVRAALGILLILVLAPVSGGADSAAPDAVPGLVHYQGRFTDPGGGPLDGPVTLRFSIHAAATGGASLWSEEHADVVLNEGVANVLLGGLVAFPAAAFSASERYLQIEVDGEPLVPRLRFASVPFAIEADRLDGFEAGDFEFAGVAAALDGILLEAVNDSLAASDGTPPNDGSNRVHWDNLAGVPEDFADGTDDGGTGRDSDHGQLIGLDDDDHPQYLLRSDAATGDGDGPNTGSNRIHWENLVGVPEGFADGVDGVFSGGEGVTGADVQDSSLTGIDIAPGSLTGGALAQGTITSREIALESIDGSRIVDDGIRSADILDGTVTGSDLKDKTVTAADLADGSVTGTALLDGTVTQADMGFLVGDITAVAPGPGLTGGGDAGDISLAVGAGSGISVTGSSVSLTPSYVSGSAYDGRFVVRTNPSWNPVTGATSVAGAAFRPVTPTGRFTALAGDGYLYVDSASNSGAEDEFTAPIQLPHKGQITAFWATYWDNTTGSFEIALWRARQSGSSKTKVASISTAGQTAAWQTLNDAVITETAIDNIEFVYWLEVDFPGTPQGTELRLLSVRVEYTVTAPR